MFQNYLFFVAHDIEMERSKKHFSFSVNWHFIHGSSRLSVSLSVRLSVSLSVRQSVSLSVRLSVMKFSQDWIISFFCYCTW